MAKKDRRKKKDDDAPAGVTAPATPGTEPTIPLWAIAVLYGVVTLLIFAEFVFSGDMLFGGDTEALGYMARAFYADELRNGNFPLWNPLLLGGTPFLESLAGGDSLYPLSAPLLLIMEPFRALGWKLVLHVFIAGLAMYGWTRAIGVSRPAAAVAGLAYLVAPYFVTLVYPAHDGKMFVTALTPLLFWAVETYFVAGKGRAWAATAGVIALVTLTTHFQMAYFLFLATGIYAFFRAIQLARAPEGMITEGQPSSPRAAGRFGLFLVASLVGAGAAGVQLIPAVSYIGTDSRRTATTTEASAEENKAYAASYALNQEELVSLVVPEFVGNHSGEFRPQSSGGPAWTTWTYWGRNPIKLNHEYMGLVVLILAGLSFFGAPRKGLRLFMSGLFVVSLGFALGALSPIWHLMYHLLPGVSLFRAPSMVIFLTGFATITMAALGLDLLLSWARGSAKPSVGAQRWLFGSVAAMILFMVLAGSGALYGIWQGLFGALDERQAGALEALKPFIMRGAFVAVVLSGATLALAFLAKGRRLGPVPIAAAFALLIAFDGIRIDLAFIQTRDFDQLMQVDPLVQELVDRMDDEPPFRVLDFGDSTSERVAAAMHGLELTGGHHPNDLGRYRELIGKEGSQAPQNVVLDPQIRAITNTRYLIWPTRTMGDPLEFEEFSDLTPITATQLQDGSVYEVLYEVDAFPRARLVGDVRVVPEEEAVATLMEDDFPHASTVVVNEDPGVALGGGAPVGSVEWLERSTDGSRLRTTSDRPALMVLADNWVSAWAATVDGEPVEVLRVNHAQIAVPVPPGTHEVEVRFESSAVATGLWLTFICSILAIVVALVSWIRQRGFSRPSRPAEEGFASPA